MNIVSGLRGPCINFLISTERKVLEKTLMLRKPVRKAVAIPTSTAVSLMVAAVPLALIIDRVAKPILSAMDYRETTKKKALNFVLMPLKIVAILPLAALSPLLIPVALVASTFFHFKGIEFLHHRQMRREARRQHVNAPLTPYQQQAQDIQNRRAKRRIKWKSRFRARFNDYYSTLAVVLNRSRPKKEADLVLKALSNVIHPNIRELNVHQENSPGIDAGGPRREFLSSLIKDLTTEAPSARFFKKESGMFTPMLPHGEEYSEKNLEFYENLGRVLSLSANCQISLGEVIKRETMDVIFTMSRDPFFANPIDSYDFTQNDTLERFIPLYNAINETSYGQLLEDYEAYLTAPEGLNDQALDQLYADIQNLNAEDVIPNLTREQKIAHIREAQTEMRSDAIALVKRQMLATLSVMRGMNGILDLSTVPNAEELGVRILGSRITPDLLTRRITFQEMDERKQQWFTNWIHQRSQAEIEQFLFLVTGSRGMQPGTIIVSNSPYENNNVHFATCGKRMSANFDAMTSEEEMHSILSGVLAMEGGFNTG